VNHIASVANNIILTIAFLAVAIICSGAATIAYLGGSLDGNVGGVDDQTARRFAACSISALLGVIGAWTSGQYSVFYWILFLVELVVMICMYQKACKT
jgi:hypothetical protein